MKILILGENGFSGSHFNDALLKDIHKVCAFDRTYEYFRLPLPNGEYFHSDFISVLF